MTTTPDTAAHDVEMVRSQKGIEYDLFDALRRNPTIIQAGDDICSVAAALIRAQQQRIEELTAERDALKIEAQGHAMEAKTANATIHEAYQAISDSTGEPGNWHGAEPIKALVAERDELKAENSQLRAADRDHAGAWQSSDKRRSDAEAQVSRLQARLEEAHRVIEEFSNASAGLPEQAGEEDQIILECRMGDGRRATFAWLRPSAFRAARAWKEATDADK